LRLLLALLTLCIYQKVPPEFSRTESRLGHLYYQFGSKLRQIRKLRPYHDGAGMVVNIINNISELYKMKIKLMEHLIHLCKEERKAKEVSVEGA
jgi:hypothetical protein